MDFKAGLYDSAGAGITGSNDLDIRIKRDADDFFFDFNDTTFKNAGWTTIDGAMTDIDAVNVPGEYEISVNVSGFNDGVYTVYYVYTGSPGWTSAGDFSLYNGSVASDVGTALTDINLDHLLALATAGADMTAEVVDNSVISRMLSNGDTSIFIPSTDGLQPIRDAITAGGPVVYPLDSSSTVNTGTETNTYADAQAAGGNKWEIADENGDGGAIHSATSDFTIDVIAEFNMGANRIATQVDVTGYYNRSGGGGYVVELYAYNYTTALWDKLSIGSASTEMRDRNSDTDYTLPLNVGHTDNVTTPGEVKIGFVSTRQTTQGGDVLYLDYVRVAGESTGGSTPQAIAEAVHITLDEHLTHISSYTGNIWYVSTSGDDDNSGHSPEDEFLTIGAAISAASAGDRIIVKAGTYTETGIDLNLAGLELRGEIGMIIDPASGSALTISAAHCYVELIEVRPAAGEIGFDVVAGSDHSRFMNCKQTTTGGTGWKIDSGTSYIVVARCEACEYTSVGVELNGTECILDQVICRGDGGTETGFKLNHTNAHRNLLNFCTSLDNATRSFDVVAGADDNLFQLCADSDGCGTYADAGANNTWRGFMQADIPAANVIQLGSSTQSATDLKDFADDGYDPTTDKVQGVVLVDTTTANTDVRGTDGANTTTPDAAGTAATLHATTDGKVDAVQSDVTTIAADVANIDGDAMRGTDGANTTVPDAAGIAAALHVTTDALIAALENISAADVKAQVNAVINTDTYSLPGQEAPTATPTLEEVLMYLFKFMTNKITNDGSVLKVFARDETTVDQKADVADAAGTFTRGEFEAGP